MDFPAETIQEATVRMGRNFDDQEVTVVNSPGTPEERRQQIRGHIQPKKGFFGDSTPIYVGDVVEVPDPRGGLERRGVAQVENYQGHHMEVTWGTAPAVKVPLPAASSGREKWRGRELAILEAIAAIEDRGDPFTSFEEVVEGSGLSDREASLGLHALADAEYLTGVERPVTLTWDGYVRLDRIRLLEDGRVATGQWPDSDPFADLVAALDARMATASDDQQPALAHLREALWGVGQSLGTEIVLDAYRRVRDGRL